MKSGKVTIYEKPTWSTCRQVKRILTTRGVDYRAVNYLEEPLSDDALKHLLKIAELKPQDILRTKEEAYTKYVLGRNLTDEQLIETMAKHPELIQRPIVVIGDKAVLARPIDRLAELGIQWTWAKIIDLFPESKAFPPKLNSWLIPPPDRVPQAIVSETPTENVGNPYTNTVQFFTSCWIQMMACHVHSS